MLRFTNGTIVLADALLPGREVFVLDDGAECDQDMGNYERFLNRDFSGANYMTTGSVYRSVIARERSNILPCRSRRRR